ncbi:hypothetical protein PUN28_020006 [Cardiocondyla obscurior]|uniref:Uncharacterized protein n=1 Tax=Cardiocondyla obscurior TaxID=286306 RepID=A0AAW2E6T2_9HYME
MLIRCNGSRCDLESMQPHSFYRSSVISKFLKCNSLIQRISEGLDEDISEDDFKPLRFFNIVNDDNDDDDNNANDNNNANEVWRARANHMGEVEEENENRENPEGENEEEESAPEGDFMTEMQQMFDQMFSEIGDDVAITEVTTEITNQTSHCLSIVVMIPCLCCFY